MYFLPYIFVFLLLVFIVLFAPITVSDKSIQSKINKDLVVLQSLLLFFLWIYFVCFREYVYIDWVSYKRLFDSVRPFSEIEGYWKVNTYQWERGYYVFCCIVKQFTDNYLVFQVINAFIDTICIFLLFKQYYSNRYFCLAICFFYIFNGLPIEFNLLRNSKVIFIFLFSLKYLGEKKYFKYLLLNIAATQLHNSAIIFILVTPFLLFKWSKKQVILVLFILGNFLYLLKIDLFTIIVQSVQGFLPSSMQSVVPLFFRYKNDAAYGLKIGYIERLFTFFIIYKYRPNILSLKNGRILLNSYYIYYFNYLFFAPLVTICERIGVLFSFSYWILYPYIYNQLKSKDKKYLFWCILIIYGVLKLYVANNSENFEYKNILTLCI